MICRVCVDAVHGSTGREEMIAFIKAHVRLRSLEALPTAYQMRRLLSNGDLKDIYARTSFLSFSNPPDDIHRKLHVCDNSTRYLHRSPLELRV